MMPDAVHSKPSSEGPVVQACRPLLLGPKRDRVGLLTLPRVQPQEKKPGILLTNAGVLHRVGPHRLNARLARLLAELGFTSLRFDLAGFGDSKADPEGGPFRSFAVAQMKDAMDFLETNRGLQTFIPMGLCSGADVALDTALAEPRVSAAILIDSFAYDNPIHFVRSYGKRLTQADSWKNLLAGKSDIEQRLMAKLRNLARGQENPAPSGLDADLWEMPPTDEIIDAFTAVLRRKTPILLAYSGGPAYDNYLLHFYWAFKKLGATGLSIKRFAEADHTFTMTYYQDQLLDTIVAWLQKVL